MNGNYDCSGYIVIRSSYNDLGSGNYSNDLKSKIMVNRTNVMQGKINVVPYGENDLTSMISVKTPNDITSKISLYSDFTIENPGWGTTIYGYQKRSNLYVSYRNDLTSKISITPNGRMTGVVEVVQPPKLKANFEPTQDAFLRQGVATLNYGFDQTLLAGYSLANNEIYRTLIKFDFSSLPVNVTIDAAKLSIYNAKENSSSSSISLFKVSNDWKEDSVTWKNQPPVEEIVASASVSQVGYVDFDITSLVQDWYDNPSLNYGIEIRANDETADNYFIFYSRESQSNKPNLDLTYHDETVYSFGRSNIESKVYVKHNFDLRSKIRIPLYDVNATLKSKIFVNKPDSLISRISISRPQVVSKIKVRQKDLNSLQSKIAIRNYANNDLNSKVIVSKPFLNSKINIPSRYSVPSKIWIKAKEFNQISSKITISSPDKVSKLYVRPYFNLPSKVMVRTQNLNSMSSQVKISRPDLKSTIRVKLFSDINGSITVRRIGINQIPSKVAVSRTDIFGHLTVKIANSLNSTIAVRQSKNNSLSSKIIVPAKLEIPSTISVFQTNSIQSKIYVNSGFLKSKIMIPYRATNDLHSKMLVKATYINEIESKIEVVYGGVNNLTSNIIIRAIGNKDLASKIIVPYHQINDLNSNMKVRISTLNDLTSKIIVPYKDFNDLSSNVKIRVADMKDLVSKIIIPHYERENLDSTIAIRVSDSNDLVSKIVVVTNDGAYVFIL